MRWWQIESVLAIERSVFDDSAWTPEQLWSELAGVPDRRHYVVAMQSDAVVGYAGLSFSGEAADVMTVAVAPSAQRQGVGRALMHDLLASGARLGVGEVFLEVRAGNDAATALYRALGFTDVARRRDYYGPGSDGVVMRRRLRRGEEWDAS